MSLRKGIGFCQQSEAMKYPSSLPKYPSFKLYYIKSHHDVSQVRLRYPPRIFCLMGK